MVFIELSNACTPEMTVVSVLNGPGVADGEHVQGVVFFVFACRACAGPDFLNLFKSKINETNKDIFQSLLSKSILSRK